MLNNLLPVLIRRYPAVIPHLRGWFYKSYDYYLRNLQNLVNNVYDGYMGGEFVGILSNLVLGQLSDAFETAAREEGLLEVTQRMFNAMMVMVNEERTHIEPFYRDIVDARVDEKPIGPLLSRCDLWANRWNDAYNEAKRQIALEFGGKLKWVLGPTEEHCETCGPLSGVVAFATEWEASGLKPQGSMLVCRGFRCQCKLEPTEQRRSPVHRRALLETVPRAT